jgi:hypothetical protein
VTVDFHFDFYKIRDRFVSADSPVRIGTSDGSGWFGSGDVFPDDRFFVDTSVGAARVDHGFSGKVLSIGVGYFGFNDEFLHS